MGSYWASGHLAKQRVYTTTAGNQKPMQKIESGNKDRGA
jgi:hypothetical protein